MNLGQLQKLIKKRQTSLIVIFLVIFLPLLGLFTLRRSFDLALAGDDWLILYTMWMEFDVFKTHSFFNSSAYFCTYCPPNVYMSIIKSFGGYDAFYYYLASYFLRIGAAISVFFVVKKYTKQLLPALIASSFVVVNYIGIQSTDWVFNLYHYAGVIFAVLFLISYWQAHHDLSIRSSLIAAIFFAVALISSPPRMHGLLPLVLIIEFGWLLIEGKKYNWKRSVLRVLSLLLAYKIVFSGAGYGTTAYNLSQVTKGIALGQEMVAQGQTWFLINPITSIGNYLLPNMLYNQIPFDKLTILGRQPFTFISFVLPISFVTVSISALILYILGLRRLLGWGLYFLSSGAWIFFIYFLKKTNPITFSHSHITYALIGGLTIILTLTIFFLVKKTKPLLAQMLLLGLGWMTTFSLFPWIIAPYTIFDTDMRYSLHQGIGFSVWVAVLFTLLISSNAIKGQLKTITVYLAILALTFLYAIHMAFTDNYLQNVQAHRNIRLDTKLWSTITKAVPTISKDAPSVFYLTYDDYYTAEWDLRFGFSSRGAMQYQITKQNNNPFIHLGSYEDLLSIASDGQALIKEGRPPVPIPLENIYAFDLKDNQLTETTAEVRAKLMKDMPTHQH